MFRAFLWSTLMLTAFVLSFGRQAHGLTYTYSDDPSPDVHIGGSPPQTYQVTFQITVPVHEVLRAAVLAVYLKDDETNDPEEAANIYVDGSLILKQADITNGGASVFSYEVSNYLSDHTLTLRVTRYNGGGQGKNDFLYDKSSLTISTSPVPAPSTLLLLVSGLLGLACLARRQKAGR